MAAPKIPPTRVPPEKTKVESGKSLASVPGEDHKVPPDPEKGLSKDAVKFYGRGRVWIPDGSGGGRLVEFVKPARDKKTGKLPDNWRGVYATSDKDEIAYLNGLAKSKSSGVSNG